MPNPGSIGSIATPTDPGALTRRVAELEKRIDQLSTAVPYAMASRNFNGTLNPPTVGTAGWALTASGEAIISSDLLLGGNLIGDDALQNPTSFATKYNDNNATTLAVAWTDLATVDLTVPTGFTRAQVLCFSTVGNTRTAGAGGAPFYMVAFIGSTQSATIAATCADSSSLSMSTAWVANLTGLTAGASIHCGSSAAVDSTVGWTASTANAHTVVSATFLR